VHLRCPLIPGVNDTEAHVEGIADLANSHTCIQKIDLEPYHPLGVGKAEAIGRPLAYQNTEFMDNSRAEALRDALSARVRVPVHLSGK
jgi:pyruvate formate lyase activating enzyme